MRDSVVRLGSRVVRRHHLDRGHRTRNLSKLSLSRRISIRALPRESGDWHVIFSVDRVALPAWPARSLRLPGWAHRSALCLCATSAFLSLPRVPQLSMGSPMRGCESSVHIFDGDEDYRCDSTSDLEDIVDMVSGRSVAGDSRAIVDGLSPRIMDRLRQRTAEQSVDVTIHRLGKKLWMLSCLFPRSASRSASSKIVLEPVPQILKETVELPLRRLQRHVSQ